MKKSFRITFVIVLAIFFIFFFLVSIIPHMHFKTFALDLGMFNHALYSFSRFKANTFTLEISGVLLPFMAGHFSPITYLYAPFYYLFGSYTLLLLQIMAILFGGYGVFNYARYKGISNWVSLLIMVHFFLMWGVYGALSFDFHNNVIAAMLIPWFIYYYEKGNYKLTILLLGLVLISKENMALWMVFILLALIIRKEQVPGSVSKRNALFMLMFSVVYFVIVIQVIMPALTQGLTTSQLSKYSHLGGSIGEMIGNTFNQPARYFAMLFENTLGIPGANGIKSQLLFMFLVAGGFAVFRRPYLIVMLIPIYAQKMLADNPTFWGVDYQYSIEFVPIISLAVISLIMSFKSIKITYLTVGLLIFSSVYFNSKNLDDVFNGRFYKAGLNVKEVNKAINLIPDKVPISVNSELAPHLASRDEIYHFPNVKNAKYIALLKNRSTYPLSREQFNERVKAFQNIPSSILYENEDIIIVKVEPGIIEDQVILTDPAVKSKIDEIELYIRNDHEWFSKIQEKAKIFNISVDSMLRNDAMWAYKKQMGLLEE